MFVRANRMASGDSERISRALGHIRAHSALVKVGILNGESNEDEEEEDDDDEEEDEEEEEEDILSSIIE